MFLCSKHAVEAYACYMFCIWSISYSIVLPVDALIMSTEKICVFENQYPW